VIQRISATLLSSLLLGAVLPAHADNELAEGHHVKHVLLISVDGLHALDLTNYVATHQDSTLASLTRHGLTSTSPTMAR
jgi:hypothetical protein